MNTTIDLTRVTTSVYVKQFKQYFLSQFQIISQPPILSLKLTNHLTPWCGALSRQL